MSRKPVENNDNYLDMMTSCNGYPQPYMTQPPMIAPYPGSQPAPAPGPMPAPINPLLNNANPMFLMEPVPIKKRNRIAMPVLLLLTMIISLAYAIVAVWFMPSIAFVNLSETSSVFEKSIEESVTTKMLPVEKSAGDIATLTKDGVVVTANNGTKFDTLGKYLQNKKVSKPVAGLLNFCVKAKHKSLTKVYSDKSVKITNFVTETIIMAIASVRNTIILWIAVNIALNILIFGTYGLGVMCHISQEINLIASDYDYRTTPFYCMAVFFSLLTLGFYRVVYMNSLTARIGSELKRRNIKYKFDEGSYWGWCVFGLLLVGIGPIVFCYKLMKAMRALIDDYNVFG